jgi:hypothetical protein
MKHLEWLGMTLLAIGAAEACGIAGYESDPAVTVSLAECAAVLVPVFVGGALVAWCRRESAATRAMVVARSLGPPLITRPSSESNQHG